MMESSGSVPHNVIGMPIRFRNYTTTYMAMTSSLRKHFLTLVFGEIFARSVALPVQNSIAATGPKRGTGTWDEFLKIHAKTLLQCDFYSKKAVTPTGLKDLYLLVFLQVGTRRVFVAPSTYHPNEEWVLEQAAAFRNHVNSEESASIITRNDRTRDWRTTS